MVFKSNKWSAVLIALVVSCLAIGTTSQDVYAGKKSKAKAKVQQQKADSISASLGEVKWGSSDREVLDVLKKQMFDGLNKDEQLKKDKLLMQRARKEAMDKFSDIEKSKLELKGTRTGYEVSVIADEFTPDVGESIILVRDKVAQRYYFFMHNRLYKLVVAYDKSYLNGVDFEPFAAQTAQRYGRPISTDYGDVFGEEELTGVTWEDDSSVLSVHNKREFFGTFTMVFSDRKRVQELTSRGVNFGGKGKKVKKEAEISSEVAMLTQDNANSANKTVVDSMVGSVDIDLNEGRPEDEKLRPDEQPSGQAAEDDSKTKTKKAKPKKTKPKKAKPRRKFDQIDAGDNELVIY